MFSMFSNVFQCFQGCKNERKVYQVQGSLCTQLVLLWMIGQINEV